MTGTYDTEVEMYCLAHRRRVTWLPAPAWWIHVKDINHLDHRDGNPTDPRGCMAMWGDRAPRLDGRPAASSVTVTMPLNSENARIALGLVTGHEFQAPPADWGWGDHCTWFDTTPPVPLHPVACDRVRQDHASSLAEPAPPPAGLPYLDGDNIVKNWYHRGP